jgi:Tfp pilus assembly protein PilO
VNAIRANRKAAIALIVGGDLIVLMLGWFLLIGPQLATASEISKATQATEAQIVEASRPIATPKPAAVQQQPDIRTADLYSLAKAMPSDLDTPDLLLELNLLARESGVTLGTISPGDPVSEGTYTTVPVALSVTGDFYGLTDYLYRLRTLVGVSGGQLRTAGRLYSVGQIAITGGTAGTALQATLTVSAYVWGSDGLAPPATSAVTPAAPTTDTSSTTTTTSN